jgi:hypothetical protein
MVHQRSRGQILSGDDWSLDRPGPQGFAVLQHEVPMDAIPEVLE